MTRTHYADRGKTDLETPCVEWTRYRNANGYGTVTIKNERLLAHRVAYESAHGPIPKGMYVLHSCDNPPCVNPEHLRLGSQTDNMADAAAKRRTASGERNGMAKLTWKEVREMRSRYAAGEFEGLRFQDIAALYGVTAMLAWKIIHRRLWVEA